MIRGGKSPLGMENIRCGSQGREFMDPINIATSGGSLSAERTVARVRIVLGGAAARAHRTKLPKEIAGNGERRGARARCEPA
jgi:hypothetical protein